jgi:Protein of unknown function (DUF732)
MARIILLAAVPVATVVGFAVPAAHADEGGYINLLSQSGTDVSNRAAIVQTGMTACNALRAGSSYLNVAKTIISASYTARDTGRIIYAAAMQLCPDQLSNVNAQVNALEGPPS